MERIHTDTAGVGLDSLGCAEPEPYKRQRLPDILTPEDRARIPANDDVESVVRFLEAMNARYENHPYFTAQLAMRMEALGATVISARLLRQVFTYPYPGPHLMTASDQAILRTPRDRRPSAQRNRGAIHKGSPPPVSGTGPAITHL